MRPLGVPTPPGLERDVGMERFLTGGPGIGGRLKAHAEDFVVEEVPLAFPPPSAEGKYTVAAIRARNWETNRLVGEMARRLGVPRETIFFAGTKDKRAVTTQYVSLRASEEAVRAMGLADVEVLETRRVDRAPKIGELVGNRFAIRVRDPGCPVDEAEARLGAVLDGLAAHGGFPNYFGVQRFGVLRPVTHRVGEAILRGDLEEAVRLYAGNPSPLEHEEARKARETYDATRDPDAVLPLLPRHMGFEREMLLHLQRKPRDFEGAILALPGNLRTMFVYAAQSVLFNRALARRLEAGLGLNEPAVGDVVVGVDADGTPEKDRPHRVTPLNRERVARLCAKGAALVTGSIVGHETVFPEGPMGEIERAVLAEAGWRPGHFRVPHLPEVASAGTRRELLAPLGPVRRARGEDAHGSYLEVAFFLLKGSYATCLLREAMKATDPIAYA
ncbi:MAG TPA: tRNA pseudouridine(13) synthase TruD [Candidatus Thermoplasmatota archaeon]|nr:tRNA pseudouridine(13) synthase TruD [Candidatus Thermoplasmatota archaeon]